MPEDTKPKPEKDESLAATVTALEAEVEKWKAHSRKNEDRAKENAEAAKRSEELQKKLDDIEASKLSDSEKVEKKLAELATALETEQAARKTAELSALKARIGAEKGLSPAFSARLQGEDETSIAADADALLEASKADGFVDIGQGKRGTPSSEGTGGPLHAALKAKVGG